MLRSHGDLPTSTLARLQPKKGNVAPLLTPFNKKSSQVSECLLDGGKCGAPCCAELISDVIAGGVDAGIIAPWQRFRGAPGITGMWTDGGHRELGLFR